MDNLWEGVLHLVQVGAVGNLITQKKAKEPPLMPKVMSTMARGAPTLAKEKVNKKPMPIKAKVTRGKFQHYVGTAGGKTSQWTTCGGIAPTKENLRKNPNPHRFVTHVQGLDTPQIICIGNAHGGRTHKVIGRKKVQNPQQKIM